MWIFVKHCANSIKRKVMVCSLKDFLKKFYHSFIQLFWYVHFWTKPACRLFRTLPLLLFFLAEFLVTYPAQKSHKDACIFITHQSMRQLFLSARTQSSKETASATRKVKFYIVQNLKTAAIELLRGNSNSLSFRKSNKIF